MVPSTASCVYNREGNATFSIAFFSIPMECISIYGVFTKRVTHLGGREVLGTSSLSTELCIAITVNMSKNECSLNDFFPPRLFFLNQP